MVGSSVLICVTLVPCMRISVAHIYSYINLCDPEFKEKMLFLILITLVLKSGDIK